MNYPYAASDGEDKKSQTGRLNTAGVNKQNKETTTHSCLASFRAMFATGSASNPAKPYICNC